MKRRHALPIIISAPALAYLGGCAKKDEESYKYEEPREKSIENGDYDSAPPAASPTPYPPMFYVSESGAKYHTRPDCPMIRDQETTMISAEEARRMGFEPCMVCMAPR